MIQLLEEVHDPDYWMDGCCRLILHCVRFKQLRFVENINNFFFPFSLQKIIHISQFAYAEHFSPLFHSSSATDLLKQLKDKFKDDEMAMEYHFSEVCSCSWAGANIVYKQLAKKCILSVRIIVVD